jgi:argininosuccinate lyase
MKIAGTDSPRQKKTFALWGARFTSGLAPEAEALNRSLPVDRRLWREELEVAVAWTEALVDVGVLARNDAEKLRDGLGRVGERLATGAADDAPDEDIHTLVERLLTEEVGELAGRLRAGRSRNDTVATATRLWAVRAARALADDVARLQSALIVRAQATVDVLMPAYTHLQRAQPMRMAQFFLAHFWALQRDRERWAQVERRASSLPLGAGAIAGSGFPVDRTALARRLGFDRVAENSVDAVSDRDFVAEFAFAGALLGAHVSRLAEDLVLFSSAEFGFLRFADAYSTGSSLLPQKRNPDVAELARGQSAGLLGDAVAALALLKGLSAGYSKDFQQDKPILFRVYDTLHRLLPPLAGAVETMAVDPEAAAAALDPTVLAVDIADALVRSGATFREAHAAVGALVRLAEETDASILEVDPERAASLHPALPRILADMGGGGPAQAYERSVEARNVSGGTARSSVEKQIAAARRAIPA